MTKQAHFYTVDEAAKLLRVNVQTVRRWYKEGRLPGLKIGRAIRIDANLLEARMAFLDVDAEQRRREHETSDR